jgi:ankyrin repeat protein
MLTPESMKRRHSISTAIIVLTSMVPLLLFCQSTPTTEQPSASLTATKQVGDTTDLNAVDAQGTTALMVACRWGKIDLVQGLLNRGAMVDTPRSPGGRTPLMITCAYYGGVAICQLLVDHGADVNATAKDGSTALMLAAKSAKITVVEFLLARGADPNRTDNYGKTALDYAKRADPSTFPTDLAPDNIPFDKERVIERLTILVKQ